MSECKYLFYNDIYPSCRRVDFYGADMRRMWISRMCRAEFAGEGVPPNPENEMRIYKAVSGKNRDEYYHRDFSRTHLICRIPASVTVPMVDSILVFLSENAAGPMAERLLHFSRFVSSGENGLFVPAAVSSGTVRYLNGESGSLAMWL